MLPISLNGLGVREGSLTLLLAQYGVRPDQAVALGLGWFSLGLGVGLVGGILYLFFDRNHGTHGSQTVCVPVTYLKEGKDSHGSIDRGTDEGRTGQRQAAA
jgi:hypothetical protein